MTTDVRSQELSKLELWEAGRRRLGYGDWTSETSDEPYLKYAGMQAHRLFLSMRKRRATQADFLLCVDYCARHHIRIENAIWVFTHIREAKKEAAELKAAIGSDVDRLIEAAIGCERTLADDLTESWCSRLARSQGKYREEVLHEWAQARNTSLTSLLPK